MATWFFGRGRRARRPRGVVRPAVEALEGRCLPAQLTEFRTGVSSGAMPDGITRGADGNLWFTEAQQNNIARITPAGVVTEFSLAALQSSGGSFAITSGPGGLIYFTDSNTGRIARINPLAGSDAAIQASLVQSAVIPSGNGVGALTAGPDGNVWFTDFSASKVGRITPDLATINEFPIPMASSGPNGIAAGPDGALWFTEQSANQVGRITTGGAVTNEFPIPTAGSDPQGITAGPDGNLWFTENVAEQIGQISPSGTVHEFPLPSSPGPNAITAGPDGNVWFTELTGNQIGSLSPGGTLAEYGGLASFSLPEGIVTGPDGNLWFTESTNDQIGRLVPGVTAVATSTFSGQVAAFAPADPSAAPGDFTVSIDWGDGTPPDTTTGTVAAMTGPPGLFAVRGSHTYAAPGTDTITVTLRDTRTSTNTTLTSPATVVPFANSADLEVQESGPSRATAGEDLTYTLTVTNSGPADALDVTVTDTVPDGTTFVSAQQLTGPAFNLLTPPAGGSGTVVADPVTLAAGQSATFKAVFKAGATRSITNTVTVSSLTPNRNGHTAVSVPVAVPVQLTLSSAALADYSPPGTPVGTVTLSLPVVLAGQFLPPIFGLPAAEADNAAFELAGGAAGEALVAQFRACSGAQARYQVDVHVDVGFGDQVVPVSVTVAAAASPCMSPTAPPVLESVQVVRPGRQGVPRELVLQFGTALDPGTAAALGHYTLGLGFTGHGKQRKEITVPVLAATYDPARKTITLHLGRPKGPKPHGLLTVEGELGLDGVTGGADTVSVDLRPQPSHKR